MNAHTQQLSSDEDWGWQPTEKDLAKARLKRNQLAPKLVKKLEAAAEALREYRRACVDCYDGTGGETCGRDGRLLLAADIEEYARYLGDIVDRKVLETKQRKT